jgi:hypothetical protein
VAKENSVAQCEWKVSQDTNDVKSSVEMSAKLRELRPFENLQHDVLQSPRHKKSVAALCTRLLRRLESRSAAASAHDVEPISSKPAFSRKAELECLVKLVIRTAACSSIYEAFVGCSELVLLVRVLCKPQNGPSAP